MLKNYRFINERLAFIIAACLMAVSAVVIFSGPVWDNDYWWHLATGRYMVEQKALLSSDPFTYPTEALGVTQGRDAVLNAYWASQVFFYYLHMTFGNYGMIVFRMLTFLGILGSICWTGYKMGASFQSLIFVSALAGWVSVGFTGERPQLFTFLFVPIMVFLLEWGRRHRPASVAQMKKLLVIPLVMVVWPNLHGGFIMGAALILLYALMEGVRHFSAGGEGSSYQKYFFAIALISLLATFINPNGYRIYQLVYGFEGSLLQQRTSEYISPLALFSEGAQNLYPYWIYIGLVIMIGIFSLKKIDRTHAVLFLLMAGLSLSSMRYIPLFVYATAPLAALYLSRLAEVRHLLKVAVAVCATVAVPSVVVASVISYDRYLGATIKHEMSRHRFPEDAAIFLRENLPGRKLFNHFNWGGYLIWELYPANKVFIDGRSLNMEVFSHYTHILWNPTASTQLLDRYAINAVIMPALNPYTGELYEIVPMLAGDPRWRLVFVDDTALIFVRDGDNSAIIKKFALPSELAYDQAIRQMQDLVEKRLVSRKKWLDLEKIFVARGLFKEADKIRQARKY